MQYPDILTIAIIALPTAFAALMLMDFIAGLLHLIQLRSFASALAPQTATSTCNAFGAGYGGRVLLQYSNWPIDKSGGFNPPSFFWDSPRITNPKQAITTLQPIQEPITEEAEGKGALSRGTELFLSARSEAEHGYEAPPFQGARLGRGTSFVPASPPCSPLRAPLLLLTLPDPWTLQIEELSSSITHNSLTHDPLPTLLLLLPAKEQSKPSKRSKKTTAPSTDTPKRRGRPRKVA